MKKFILILFLLIPFFSMSQYKEQSMELLDLKVNSIIYITGNREWGFPVRTNILGTNKVEPFDNCPILKYYTVTKEFLIGNIMVLFPINDTTIIKDIILNDNDLKSNYNFIVIGEKFNFVVNTRSDYLLEDKNKYLLFGKQKKEEKIELCKILKK